MNTAPRVRHAFEALGIEANRIVPGLYQGSKPPAGPALARAGFDALVLCAREVQPPADEFPGVRVLRARLNDDGSPMTVDEWGEAHKAAVQVARLHERGARILVTCFAGRNRSGLVSALVLYFRTFAPGAACVEHVQWARLAPTGPTLSNPEFAGAVARLP